MRKNNEIFQQSFEEIRTKILNHKLLKPNKIKLKSSGSEDEQGGQSAGEDEKKPQDPRCSVEALPSDLSPLPLQFSWKDKGFVSPVYEQGKRKK